jgi:phage gpG-like protein
MSGDALSIDVRGAALLAKLRGTQQRLQGELRREVIRLSIEVQASVKADKLTGQVLHVRTGTLRRSINRRIDETLSGVTATVGTNVKYAGVHEYGFSGTVNIKAHIRKITQAFGRPLAAPTIANVRAHTASRNLPARSFLRSTLADKAQHINTSLRSAVLRAVTP